MAYSEDFRWKVLSFIDRGESEAVVARRFDIGVRTVRRFKLQRRLTGHVAAQKTGPKQPVKLTPADDQLMREQVPLARCVLPVPALPMKQALNF